MDLHPQIHAFDTLQVFGVRCSGRNIFIILIPRLIPKKVLSFLHLKLCMLNQCYLSGEFHRLNLKDAS